MHSRTAICTRKSTFYRRFMKILEFEAISGTGVVKNVQTDANVRKWDEFQKLPGSWPKRIHCSRRAEARDERLLKSWLHNDRTTTEEKRKKGYQGVRNREVHRRYGDHRREGHGVEIREMALPLNVEQDSVVVPVAKCFPPVG